MQVDLGQILQFFALLVVGGAAISGAYWKLVTRMDAGDDKLHERVNDLSQRTVGREEINRLEARFDKLQEMQERERDRAETRHSDLINLLTRSFLNRHEDRPGNN